jgi:hypothetical protein
LIEEDSSKEEIKEFYFAYGRDSMISQWPGREVKGRRGEIEMKERRACM